MRMRKDLVAVAGIALLAIAWVARDVVPLIVLSIVYAVVTWPLVRRLTAWLPRALAAAAVHIGIVVVVAVAFVFLWPFVYAQWQAMLPDLPNAARVAFSSLPAQVQAYLGAELQNVDLTFAAWSHEALLTGTMVLRSTTGIVGAIVLVPVLAAYFQLDAPRYAAALARVLPVEMQAASIRAGSAAALAIGGFFRGQIIVSALVGIMVYVALSLTGIPHAAIIALFTAAFDLVPYLGGIVAFVPSILLALVAGGIFKAILVAALLIVAFEIEAQILSPQIIGPQTKLPASAIIISLLCGSALFGILGLYLAVPVIAAVVAALRTLIFSSAGQTASATESQATPPH
ncbi:MAG TPA: AI-2E family transporter [Candidatus Baltobacteraceae bacterium]|nr:AI-2E family transporter [Candidatus Baltobacteraceae bacterium]